MNRMPSNSHLLKRCAILSAILHAVMLACGQLQFFTQKKDNILLTDVEIVGEGDFIGPVTKPQTPVLSPEILPEVPPEPPPEPIPPVEEAPPPPQAEAAPEAAPQQKASTQAKSDDEVEPIQEEKSDKDAAEEVKPEAEKPEVAEKEKSEQVPQLREEETKPNEPEIKKEKKKRDKNALLEVIRSAEKKKARTEARKKLLSMADDAAKKKKKNSAFDHMLKKSISDMKKRSKDDAPSDAFSGGGNGNVSGMDYEMISSQIYPHWVVPSGVKDAENITVEIQVQLRDNGEVIPSRVKILDEKRYATDYIFRAAADSARRAILEASPLKIPRNKMYLFREFIFRFNLKEALGG
ncbi:MAG: hypothetical protein LBB63_02540 [Holosporaceae bacterium]|nr:hypothetical protein [Holosporaceae bacterium]